MKSKLNLLWILAMGLAFNPVAFADDHETDDDETMTVVDEDNGEEDVVEYVPLPVPNDNDNAAFGIGVANAARDPANPKGEGHDFGQWVAKEARARADVKEQASDNAAAAADVRADAANDAADNSRRDMRDDNPGRGRPGS